MDRRDFLKALVVFVAVPLVGKIAEEEMVDLGGGWSMPRSDFNRWFRTGGTLTSPSGEGGYYILPAAAEHSYG